MLRNANGNARGYGNDAYASFMQEWREKQSRVYDLAELVDADSFQDADYSEN